MKSLILSALVIAFLPISAQAFKSNAKGVEWAKKVYNRPDGDSSVALVDMILEETKSKKQRRRKLYMYGMENKKFTYSLIRFIEPADVKNLGLLTVDAKKGDSNHYNGKEPCVHKT